MRPLDDIERSVEELNVTTTSPADERILGDAFAALEEAVVMEDGLIAPAVWQRILRSGIVRAAAAMLVIGGILVCVTVLRPPIVAPPVGAPQPAVTQADLKHIAEMAVAGDVEGLVDVLKDGPFEIKVLAAFCLGEVGDERALPELRRQYLLAEEKLPAGYGKNPFAAPIAEIEKRIRDRQQPALPAVDANVAGRPDVSETFGADANRTGTVVIPPESERALDFLVVHKETGEPIVGARLNIRIKRQGPDETNEAVTGEEGHYRIDIGGEDTNYVRIEVSKEDFVPVRVLFTTQEEAVVPAEYTLELERGSPLGGFIRNEAGEPVEGVTLYVQAWGRPESEVERIFIRDHRETTDANGLWRCDALPARLRSVYVRLTHPDYIDDESYYVRAAPPIELLREMSAVMVMKKGVHVAGGVVDFNGQAVSDADVRQGEATGYGGVDYPSARTGADGKFEFRSTRPGQLTLTVRAKGFAPELKEIAVYEGMRPIEFRLGPAHIIRGRVVDSGDNPIEGVEVSVSNWRGRRSIRWHTRTKAGGYFEWSEAPTDEVIFGFSRKGYIPVANLGLLPSTAQHIIEMYRALRIAGSVVDADTNQRVLEFRLIPGARWREGGRTSWDHDSAKRFEHGRYESTFGKARYGYFIRIEADGYMPAVSRMFTEEEEDVAFDFRLQKGEGAGGRVFTAEGEPATGAKVIVCTASMHGKIQDGKSVERADRRPLKTGDDGRFTMPPQTDTCLLVVIHDRGYAEVRDEDFLADPNIVLESWGRVEGILRVGHQRQADEQVSLEYCRVYEPNLPRVWFSYNTVTDANGSFALERVAPGKVKVGHVSGSSGGITQSHAEVVDIHAGETVEVTLGGGGQLVVGRLSMPADYNEPVDWSKAIGGAELKLAEPPRPEDFDQMIDTEKQQWQNAWRKSEEGKAYDRMQWERGRSYALRTESDGAFRIEDVPAGKYQLQVTIGRRPGGFWSSGSRGGFSSAAYAGTLNYEFEVPDLNEQTGGGLVDLGTLELETKKPLRVGDPAPAFRAETFDGNEIKLADYRGKVVFLVFWNTETAFRAQEFEKVQQICRRFSRNDRFVIIGLSLDADPAAARTFAKENELGWISCYPSREMRVKVSKDYEIWGFPSTFVIGADGRILARNPSSLLLKSVLEEALIDHDSDEDLGEGLFRF